MAEQLWWFRDEPSVQFPYQQPQGLFIQHYAWCCDYCGDVWARLIFANIPYEFPGSGDRWYFIRRRCPKHGTGTVLDHVTLSYLKSYPIPQEIFLRDIQLEISRHEQISNLCRREPILA